MSRALTLVAEVAVLALVLALFLIALAAVLGGYVDPPSNFTAP